MTGPREPTYPTDTAWLAALKRREPWAWDQLQREALDTVFGYIYLRCRQREEAEDLTAEVFASAVASIDQFRGDARVSTWLIGIARRKLIDAARRRQRRPEVLETDLGDPQDAAAALADACGPAESPERAFERNETVTLVRRLILDLPDAQREALWLRCVDQLSLAETAQVLRRSENAVKALLHRARASLMERLTAAEAHPTWLQESKHVDSSLQSAFPAAPAPPGK